MRPGIEYRFTPKYGILLDYSLTKSQSPASDVSEGTEIDLVDFWIYRYGSKFSANWNRFPWDARYYHEESSYVSEYKDSESVNDEFSFTGYIKMFSKTDLVWEYIFGETGYPVREDDDFKYDKYLIGIRGKIAPKILGVIKFGLGNFDFQNGRSEDSEEISLLLTYNLAKRLMFNLNVERAIAESTQGTSSSSENTSWALSFRYFPPFSKRLTLSGGVSFANADADSGLRDDTFGFSAGADFGITKEIKLSLTYARTDVDSSDADRDYSRNVVSLKGRLDF